MDTEKQIEKLVQVQFVGGFLHGRKAYMASPEARMVMESPAGESSSYRRRIVESLTENGERFTVATYAPEDLPDHAFTQLVLDAARSALFKG